MPDELKAELETQGKDIAESPESHVEQKQEEDVERGKQDEEVKPEDTRDIIRRAMEGKEKKESPGGEQKPPESKAEKKPAEADKEKQAEKKERKYNPYAAWKPEAQEELAKLPDNVQKMIQDRESQFHKGLEKYKSDASLGRQFQKLVAPHAQYLQQLGTTPDKAFSSLIGIDRALRTGDAPRRMQIIQALAADYGVDLAQAAQQPFDHNAMRNQAEINRLNQRITQMQQPRQADIYAQDTMAQVEHFASQNEYFDEVRDTMADLIERGMAKDLDDAYHKAVRMTPGVYDKIFAQQQERKRHEEAFKADQAAKAAKAAAVGVRGAPTGTTRMPEPRSTEDAVRQAMIQHGIIK